MTSPAITAAPSIAWSDPGRAHAFSTWLGETAAIYPLRAETLRLASADASFRRYFRVDAQTAVHGRPSFIIMDAPPALENSQSFVDVAALMQQAGLNAPHVLAWDQALGFMLLSDLGPQTMLEAMAIPAALTTPTATVTPNPKQNALYLQAVDALVRWQVTTQAGVLPPYDDALLSRELALFPEWYVGKHRGFVMRAAQEDQLMEIFALLKADNLQALGGARVFVHRDFMARNLMVSATDTVPAGLGVLDFQDAVYGPLTYDIASLMRDAFVSWDESFVLDITARYWQQARQAGLPVGDDFAEFYRAVEWMGLQRHLKVLGIFARLGLRDGKPKYLADTPRFVRYVRQTAGRYRALAPLKILLDEVEGYVEPSGHMFGR